MIRGDVRANVNLAVTIRQICCCFFNSKVEDIYRRYFQLEVFHDELWTPKHCCRIFYNGLMVWSKGQRKSMQFGIPMRWLDPGEHDDANCYVCQNAAILNLNRYRRKSFVYKSVPSALLPVPHSDELPVPELHPGIPSQPIARLLYSISYSMHSKEDLDDLCGDLFAIRVFAQCTGIPTSVRKQLRGSLKALLYKSARYQEIAENELFPHKKLKLDNNEECKEKPEDVSSKASVNDDCKEHNTKRTDVNKPDPMDEDDNKNKDGIDMDMDKKCNDEQKTVTSLLQQTEDKDKKDEEKEDAAAKTEVDEKMDISIESLKIEKSAHVIDTKQDKKELESENKEAKSTPLCADKQDDINEDSPSTSAEAAAAAAAATKSSSGQSSSSCCIHSQKNCNKKTAEDRILDEHEKRIKLLLTMETYIKSILILMQKDESNSPNAANQINMDDTMESEHNTTPVPESSDEGGGCGNNNSQGSAFNCNSSSAATNTTNNSNITTLPERQKVKECKDIEENESSTPCKDETFNTDTDTDTITQTPQSQATTQHTNKTSSDDTLINSSMASTSTATNSPQI